MTQYPLVLPPQALLICSIRLFTRNSTLLALLKCLATTLWTQLSQRTHVLQNSLPSTKRSEMNSLKAHRNYKLHFNCSFTSSVQRPVLWSEHLCDQEPFVGASCYACTAGQGSISFLESYLVNLLWLHLQTAYTIPILAFAFVCHPEVLPIYTELSK